MKTKAELPACPVATAIALIGGKWKLLILRNLKGAPVAIQRIAAGFGRNFAKSVDGQFAANDRRWVGVPA